MYLKAEDLYALWFTLNSATKDARRFLDLVGDGDGADLIPADYDVKKMYTEIDADIGAIVRENWGQIRGKIDHELSSEIQLLIQARTYIQDRDEFGFDD